jgi:hypothetical protein
MITAQPDLFTAAEPYDRIHPAPFQPSSKMSEEAAKISQGKISARNRQILRQAYDAENRNPRGITRKDVERVQGMATPTVCARLNALEQARKLRKLYTIKKGAEELVTRERCAAYVLGSKFSDRDIL